LTGAKRQTHTSIHSKNTELRPWGSFTILDEGEQFKVKRLTVNPGHSTSLQYHKHRSERWIVVRGVATVTLGVKSYVVEENDWIYIPLHEKHLLANNGNKVLQLIEVQYGNYLGEDDIFRLEDSYGRQ
jgi:mannose-1-phosphate guanylyltransferase/mannose-6-phosphate isomerase